MSEFRRDAPLKTTARGLKPIADGNICGQLHVLYGHSPLSNRLGKVRLEIFADPAERRRDLGASDHEAGPEGIVDGFLQNFVKAKDMRTIGVRLTEPGWCQELVGAVKTVLGISFGP